MEAVSSEMLRKTEVMHNRAGIEVFALYKSVRNDLFLWV